MAKKRDYEFVLEQIANVKVEALLEDIKNQSLPYGEEGHVCYPYVTGALKAHLEHIVNMSRNVLEKK